MAELPDYSSQRAHLRRLQATRDELSQRLEMLRMLVMGQQEQLAREEELMDTMSNIRTTPAGPAGPRIIMQLESAEARNPREHRESILDRMEQRRVQRRAESLSTSGVDHEETFATGSGSGTRGVRVMLGGSGNAGGIRTPRDLVDSLEAAMMLHAIQLSLQQSEAKPSVPAISEEAKAHRLHHFHLTKETLKNMMEKPRNGKKNKVLAEDLNSMGSKDCAICQENMDWLTQCTELPCGHFFCKECILPWLEKTRTCPICREEVLAEGEERTQEKTSAARTRSESPAHRRQSPEPAPVRTRTVPPPMNRPRSPSTRTSPPPREELSFHRPPSQEGLAQLRNPRTTRFIEPPQNGTARFFPSVFRNHSEDEGTVEIGRVNSNSEVTPPPPPPRQAGNRVFLLPSTSSTTAGGEGDIPPSTDSPSFRAESNGGSRLSASQPDVGSEASAGRSSNMGPRHTTSMRSSGAGRVHSLRSSVDEARSSSSNTAPIHSNSTAGSGGVQAELSENERALLRAMNPLMGRSTSTRTDGASNQRRDSTASIQTGSTIRRTGSVRGSGGNIGRLRSQIGSTNSGTTSRPRGNNPTNTRRRGN